jgi:hypothetical protein
VSSSPHAQMMRRCDTGMKYTSAIAWNRRLVAGVPAPDGAVGPGAREAADDHVPLLDELDDLHINITEGPEEGFNPVPDGGGQHRVVDAVDHIQAAVGSSPR